MMVASVRHADTQTPATSSDTAIPPRSAGNRMDPVQNETVEGGHGSGQQDAGFASGHLPQFAPLPQVQPYSGHSRDDCLTTADADLGADSHNYHFHKLPYPISNVVCDHNLNKQQLPPPFTATNHQVSVQQIPHPHHHYTILPAPPQVATYHPSHFQALTPSLSSANHSPAGHLGPVAQGHPSNPDDGPSSGGSTSAGSISRQNSTERNFSCEKCGQKFFRKQDKDR
ncbi:hypothetical protein BC830DRAFT_171514 [Chytriomyces sp. MP71]|nr:hypothetical protein BC830DRAFT_171514 [Chytriomyces sp. MP71]